MKNLVSSALALLLLLIGINFYSQISQIKSTANLAQVYSILNNGNGLKGDYFIGNNFQSLVISRTDPTINFSWAVGGPFTTSEFPSNNFSVRWTGYVEPKFAEEYTFYTHSDDGVRLWVDGEQIIDNWSDHSSTENSGRMYLNAGQRYVIKMEYYENTGNAEAKLFWSSHSQPKQIIPQSQLYTALPVVTESISTSISTTEQPDPICPAPGVGVFTGCYYDAINFNSLKFVRTDRAIDFNWPRGTSPSPLINEETFSVKWSGVFPFEAGNYKFTATADDGMRVYVDGVRIIDAWIDQSATTYTTEKSMTAGEHTIIVEYYENAYDAVAKLSWENVSSTTPTPEPTPTPTPTPTTLTIGDFVITTNRLNIRSEPQGKRIGFQHAGSRGKIVSGPIKAGGHEWWNVDYVNSPDGWSAGEYLFKELGTIPTPTPEPTPTPSPTPAPIVSISASPRSITSGQSSTLSWSSTNTTSCIASDGWTGSKTTSGTQTVTPTSNTTYTLTCSGNGGNATQSANITVNTTIAIPPSTKFVIGDSVQTTSVLNIRSTANGTLLGTQAVGSTGTVTAGPVYTGGYHWWNVDFASGVDGWGAEDFLVKSIATSPPITNVTLPELPRVYVNTTLPTQTGNTITVNAGDNLQTAINNAQPGDTIVLQAGATFTGNFVLPTKNNPNNGWIVIRTSAINSLPAEGQRVNLTHAQYMPKISSPNAESVIRTSPGANYYRLIGVEVTATGNYKVGARPDGSDIYLNNGLISLGSSGSEQDTLSEVPHHFVIDRSYIHGNDNLHVKRGVTMNCAQCAVIDSTISEIHGLGQDTQAILGWNGPGPIKIVNNFLEGSGENVMFGGADPSITNLVPSDIEIKNNHIYKPLTWKIGHSTYEGVPWLVKNLFETKNNQRVLIEGNILENSWAHGQSGFGFVMKSSNQDGSCPWCVSQDVTVRNNIMKNTGNGASIHGLDAYSGGGGISQRRMLFENNIFENAGYRLFQITLGHGAPQEDIVIRKNTVWSNDPGSYPAMFILDGGGTVVDRLTVENNILVPGMSGYTVMGSGIARGVPSLNYFINNWQFRGNAFVAQPDLATNTITGNTYTTRTSGGFVNPSSGNFALTSSSPLKGTAYAGGDPGADVSTVLNATRGAVSGVWSGSSNPTPSPTPAPTVSLSASPTSITSGQSSTLSWTSTNATSCTASGGWTGSKTTSGSQTVSPSSNTSYTLTCVGSGGSSTQSTTINVSAIATTPLPTFSGDLVVFPNKNIEFIIGPQVKANSSSSPWPWHDQTLITRGLEHGNNFPISPSLEPIDNDTYLNRNYYDLSLSLYTAYYRTGDQQFLTLARKVADSWWQHNSIASGARLPEDSMAPRSVALGGLMLRALDGRPEMWPWITSYVRHHHWSWLERHLTRSTLWYGVRDGGYMLLYASLLAEVHPDQAVRDEFETKAMKSSKDYYARLQSADGGWYWAIDTDWDPNTPDINASQPFQVGILMEGMIKIHQITGDATLRQSIINAADWLYTKSYERQSVTNLNNVLWRAMRYFTLESNYTSNNRTSAFQYGMNDGGMRDARELNPTTIHTFGYAYKLTGDPKYKTYGDDVFSATFGKGQGPGADQYNGLADYRGKEFNQNYRSASRYLAWRLGF